MRRLSTHAPDAIPLMTAAIKHRRHAMRDLLIVAAMPFLPATVSASNGMRIVVAGGAITETLFALGASDQLVGVDTTSLYPLAAQRLPTVGYMRTLSAEGVLSLSPTHVLVTEDAGPPTVLRQLIESGIKIEMLDGGHSIDGMLQRVTRVGAIIDKETQARALHTRLKTEWADALTHADGLRAQREQRLKGRPTRILFVLSHSISQVMVAGRDTAAHSMIEFIGAQNAAASFVGYKPLTAEAAVAAAPDLILATDQGLQAAGGVTGLLRQPGLAATPAGRAQRVVTLDALLLLGFGPRLPLAVRQLSETCTQALVDKSMGAINMESTRA